jgi:hypothetical protein
MQTNDFEMVPGYFGPHVRGKLAGQRKARDWSIQPVDDGSIIVQADGAIGQFDFRTRRGVLNVKGEYFPHLRPELGAKPYEFPAEFVRLALEACPGLDSESTRGGVTVVNTVRTIR